MLESGNKVKRTSPKWNGTEITNFHSGIENVGLGKGGNKIGAGVLPNSLIKGLGTEHTLEKGDQVVAQTTK